MPILLYGVIYVIVFHYLEVREVRQYYIPELMADQRIPFVPEFIVFYLGWFLWIPFICVYALFTDESAFRKTGLYLCLGMTFFLAISAVLPTKLYLRPLVVENTFFSQAVRILYHTDTSTNVFPSIHVYNTVAVLVCVFEAQGRLFQRKAFRLCAIGMSLGIILSTLFLKQHSILDVIGGLLLYPLIRFCCNLYADRKRTEAESETCVTE